MRNCTMRMTATYAAVLAATPAAWSAIPGPARELTSPTTIISPARPAAAPIPLRDLYATRVIMGAVWADAGRSVVVSTNITGRFNLWKLSADGQGEAVQLTSSNQAALFISSSPDGSRIVFSSDHDGDQRYELFMVPAAGGPIRNVTKTNDAAEMLAHFSPDGKSMAFIRKPKTASSWDVAVVELATGKVRLLTHEADPKFSWRVAAWAPDGRAVIANRSDNGDVYTSAWQIDVASGEARELTPGGADRRTEASAISPDGRLLAVTSNRESEQARAGILDFQTGRYRWLQSSPWEQRTGVFSSDSRFLDFTTQLDGRKRMSVTDLRARRSKDVAAPEGSNAFPGQIIANFAADSKRLLLVHQSAGSPPELWVASPDGASARQLTHLTPETVARAALPPARLVHYASQDGTVISAFLWMPFNLSRDGGAPAVVFPHGGPTDQMEDDFSPIATGLAQHGYVVIAPNVRGSTGYGRVFQNANRGDLGGADLIDEVYAARFVVRTGYVNGSRIGITGGSYGGYMTMMALGKTPTVWAAGVERSGIIDWRTMATTTDPALQQYMRFLLGDPLKDRIVYEKASPLAYLKDYRAPLLVIQGANDPVVPPAQARQVTDGLKAAGKVVESKFYPDEGHGMMKVENNVDALQLTLDWFDKYLKGPRTARSN